MNRKILGVLIFITAAILVITAIHQYVQNRQPEYDGRLLILPLRTDKSLDIQKSILSYEIPALLSHSLNQIVEKGIVITPVEWTWKCLDKDSVFEAKYIDRFMEKAGFSHCFQGRFSKQYDNYILTYSINTTENDIVADTVTFTLAELGSAVGKMALTTANALKKDNYRSPIVAVSKSSNAIAMTANAFLHYLRENDKTAGYFSTIALDIDSLYARPYAIKAMIDYSKAIELREVSEDTSKPFFESMKRALLKSISLDSTDSQTYRLMGEYYIYNERWSIAESFLKKAHRLNPNNYHIYLALSRLHKFRYKTLGYDSEEELYQKAISLNPCAEEAYLLLSDYYLYNNKRSESIRTLKAYLEINPKSVASLMALGKIHIVRNDAEEVEGIFNEIVRLEPDNADAYYNLGVHHYNLENYEEAKKNFVLAIAIDDHVNSHLYLAYIHELEGNIESAIDHLRTRIRMRNGIEDEFAEEARKHLYKLVHSDSTILSP
ncbi:MAG: tetratricopeptide repeat protein [candidate division KSB1 bacterium]|nr:tetratricopeptide repeat protein [candidate division KSB1 bacterium]